MNPLSYNSQASFNASNASFNPNSASLLADHQPYGSGGGAIVTGSSSPFGGGNANASSYAQSPQTYQQQKQQQQQLLQQQHLSSSSANVYHPNQGGSSGGGGQVYSPLAVATASSSSPYAPYESQNSYGATSNVSSPYDASSYDNLVAAAAAAAAAATGRNVSATSSSSSMDEHMKKQLDDQLLTKVSQMALEQVKKLLAEKQLELQATSNSIRNQIRGSKESFVLDQSGKLNVTGNASEREEFC